MTQTMTGRCLCGDVSYTGKGAPSAVHACHCADCAKWVGGPFFGVEFEGGVQTAGTALTWYESSDWAARGHCASCGSAMFWRLQHSDAHFTVTLGTLDDPSKIQPIDRHIFIDKMTGHYNFDDNAERLTAAEAMAQFGGDPE